MILWSFLRWGFIIEITVWGNIFSGKFATKLIYSHCEESGVHAFCLTQEQAMASWWWDESYHKIILSQDSPSSDPNGTHISRGFMFRTDQRCTVCQRLVQIPHHFSITSYLLHSPTEKPFHLLTILTWARLSETPTGEVLWLWAGGDQVEHLFKFGVPYSSFWKAYPLGPIVTNSKSTWFLTFSIVIPKTALLSNLDISFSKSSSLSYVFSALKSIQVFNQARCWNLIILWYCFTLTFF